MNGNKVLLHRIIQTRPHLSLAVGLGFVAALLVPESLPALTRALVGWNVTVWSFLGSTLWLVMRSDHHKVREIAGKQDESAKMVLATLIACAVLSLSAMISEVSRIPWESADQKALGYAFTALTVGGSWLLVGVLFSFHYAHMYYRATPDRLPLRFPDGMVTPDYWDFLYFSFTIAVAAQTSDILVLSRSMRKLVLGQSVLSFFFNLAILGLSINLTANTLNQ